MRGEPVVVAWSAETTKTNDDSTIGEAREGEKRTVRPSVDRRRWEEARFIESRGPIVKLLAIPIENASFRQQYCTCFATESLSKSVYIRRVAMVNERENKEGDSQILKLT